MGATGELSTDCLPGLACDPAGVCASLCRVSDGCGPSRCRAQPGYPDDVGLCALP
ncbi:MAG: hypothetical protein ACFCGT_03520 [Sandaracinaceae bacterium]